MTHQAPAITANLAIVGLFFAMQSCEKHDNPTPQPGRQYQDTVDMRGMIFLHINNKQEIPPNHPGLTHACCCSIYHPSSLPTKRMATSRMLSENPKNNELTTTPSCAQSDKKPPHSSSRESIDYSPGVLSGVKQQSIPINTQKQVCHRPPCVSGITTCKQADS